MGLSGEVGGQDIGVRLEKSIGLFCRSVISVGLSHGFLDARLAPSS